ncbi:hypothetical protein [Eubacterium sp.]|uniref:hypothetical protein n=1 Tax=Eubacterium sp. TaxID=142586 RepID=UPI0025C4E061|nr:hypothetical protein [Eubacterium sp.]
MTKELARYFFMLIVKDLQFSFNGMGLPNNACEWLENQLIQENFDEVEEFINKRYNERITNLTLELLKEMQKAQEPEDEIKEKAEPDFIKICKNMDKKTKTRKFRAMTVSEWCSKGIFHKSEYHLNERGKMPYKTKDGKYILREVKE